MRSKLLACGAVLLAISCSQNKPAGGDYSVSAMLVTKPMEKWPISSTTTMATYLTVRL